MEHSNYAQQSHPHQQVRHTQQQQQPIHQNIQSQNLQQKPIQKSISTKVVRSIKAIFVFSHSHE